MSQRPILTQVGRADSPGPLIQLSVTGAGAPIPHTPVTLITKCGVEIEFIKLNCDDRGKLAHQLRGDQRLIFIFIDPPSRFWPMSAEVGSSFSLYIAIDCPTIAMEGPLGWWHRICGINNFDAADGFGIAVGIVDTGAASHLALSHVHFSGAFSGDPALELRGDDLGHGTHVAGVIGGRPVAKGAFGGVAPGSELFVARVFGAVESVSNADVADAIDALVEDCTVDLINLSLGAPIRSEILSEAVLNAYEKGVLCIAAAGNDGKSVQFPAALDLVVGIGALGLNGCAPEGSHAATHAPRSPLHFAGELYVANFSARGSEVSAVAPGVGIVSTAPAKGGISLAYTVKSGTSFAAPIACGVLARELGRDKHYKAMPRDGARAAYARKRFEFMLTKLRLPSDLQGGGVPRIAGIS